MTYERSTIRRLTINIVSCCLSVRKLTRTRRGGQKPNSQPRRDAGRPDAIGEEQTDLTFGGLLHRPYLPLPSGQAEATAYLDLSAQTGNPALWTDLKRYMTEESLWDIEEMFAEQYVRNPNSGELVKGHAIVLAELGLVAFEGKQVRDADCPYFLLCCAVFYEVFNNPAGLINIGVGHEHLHAARNGIRDHSP